jgi:hypothetical protein
MLYASLDLSRKRLDFHLLDRERATVELHAQLLTQRQPPVAEEILQITFSSFS